MITSEQVLDALKHIKDPDLNRSLVDFNMIRNVNIIDNQINLEVVLVVPGGPYKGQVEKEVTETLKALGAEKINIKFGSLTDIEKPGIAEKLRGKKTVDPGVNQFGRTVPQIPLLAPGSKTKFIAVASGKGGVGKSTVTVNLAVALARMGKRVGVIDADIYGFSVPDMMGIDRRPVVLDTMILPVLRLGVKVISMGFFVEENTPVIWRGPMLGKMLRNFFTEVFWDEPDYVLLDLPPGTGDIALDVHQMIPHSKEIIVTTPHPTAAYVAVRAGNMAIQTDHEVIGVIENMSYLECGSCGSKEYVFGEGGGSALADALETELLGEIPLGDTGQDPDDSDFAPSIYFEDSPIGQTYMEIAKKIDAKCSQ